MQEVLKFHNHPQNSLNQLPTTDYELPTTDYELPTISELIIFAP